MTALGDLFQVPDVGAPCGRSMLFGLMSLIAIAVAAIVICRSLVRWMSCRERSSLLENRSDLDRLARLRRVEHDRIAGELHDTLLQGIHGLIWKFQALSERLRADDPVRAGMNEALQSADRVLVEGRDRVLNLRASEDCGAPLLQQLKKAIEEIALDPAVQLTATSQGDEFELAPRAHSEVIAIAAQALRHAYRHCSAENLELWLSFESSALRVRVVHDGADPSSEKGRTGITPEQWFPAGMHERARAISADLRIERRTTGGSRIELTVPGSIAFGAEPRRREFHTDPTNGHAEDS